jgi:hypothetical protein
MCLAQDWDQGRAIVDTIMNLRVPHNFREFLLIAFKERRCCIQLVLMCVQILYERIFKITIFRNVTPCSLVQWYAETSYWVGKIKKIYIYYFMINTLLIIDKILNHTILLC